MKDAVYFEQPLNERVRTFLRLEHLFCQADYTLRGFSVWDTRATLSTLVDTLEILSRTDFKSELIKELDRQSTKLESLVNMPGVDTEQLETVLTQLKESESALHAISGQIGQSLREHDLLNSIKQRQTIPGGTCPIDSPALHLWLQKDPEQRIEQLEAWNASLSIVRKPVALLLGIIREASNAEKLVAPEGLYQQSLDSNTPIQLIRVAIEKRSPYFAEISAGKHRLTIRFLEPQAGRRPLQAQQGINFELTCCVI